jgi:hypothetical protein
MSHVWKILNAKVKGKCPRRPRLERKQNVNKDVTQKEGRT